MEGGAHHEHTGETSLMDKAKRCFASQFHSQRRILRLLAVLVFITYTMVLISHMGGYLSLSRLRRTTSGYFGKKETEAPHHSSDLLEAIDYEAKARRHASSSTGTTDSSVASSSDKEETAATGRRGRVPVARPWFDGGTNQESSPSSSAESFEALRQKYIDGYYNNKPNDYQWRSPATWAPPPTDSPEQVVKKLFDKIEALERSEKIEGLRDRVEDLRQRQRLRDRLRREAEFNGEEEDQREKEREWERMRWDIHEKKFHRWKRHNMAELNNEYDTVPRPPSDNYGRGMEDLSDLPPKPHDGAIIASERRRTASDAKRCPGMVPKYPFQSYSEFHESTKQKDFAYVTFVTSAEFVMPAAVLMHSIAVTGSQYARAICVTPDISSSDRQKLSLFALIIEIERIASPLYISNQRYKDTFTKLRMWQLVMFKKVLYIDTDVVALKSMDTLFDIDEWGVTMDAEQDRYSTGMMILQPSLKTFDLMMEKLKTTTVSMELPDLLFLKEFFDRHKERGHINFIPRWYQVYQEEFGSQYSSYLTKRKQRLTIFDPRIHGMHFPGGGKPWNEFGKKYAKYSPHFCHWEEAMDFRYEAQFHWFVHYELMQRSVASLETRLTFDFGGGSQPIVLVKYVEEEKKKQEEETARWSYRYGGGTSPNYNYGSPPYGTYNSPHRRPSRYTSDETPAAHNKLMPKGMVWFPSKCTVPVALPADVSQLYAKRSLDAKSNNSSSGTTTMNKSNSTEMNKNSTTTGTSSVGGVVLGSLDFSELLPLVVRLTQQYQGIEGDDYEWMINWCSKTKMLPTASVSQATACGRPSYFTQFSDNMCRSNFDELLEKEVVFSAKAVECFQREDLHTAAERMKTCVEEKSLKQRERLVAGVVFRSRVTIEGPLRARWLEAKVRCDWTMDTDTAALERNTTQYIVSQVGSGSDRLYTLRLRSRCACLGGCTATGGATSAKLRKAKRFEASWKMWKAKNAKTKTIGHHCLAAGTSRSKCLSTIPGCSYDTVVGQCQPPTDQWLLITTAATNQMSSCTHVGGSGENIPTRSRCREIALKAGANVMNYYFSASAETKNKKEATTSTKVAHAGGCYYKKCDFDSWLQGDVSLLKTSKGEGFDVEVLNPFYTNATSEASAAASGTTGSSSGEGPTTANEAASGSSTGSVVDTEQKTKLTAARNKKKAGATTGTIGAVTAKPTKRKTSLPRSETHGERSESEGRPHKESHEGSGGSHSSSGTIQVSADDSSGSSPHTRKSGFQEFLKGLHQAAKKKTDAATPTRSPPLANSEPEDESIESTTSTSPPPKRRRFTLPPDNAAGAEAETKKTATFPTEQPPRRRRAKAKFDWALPDHE